MHKTNLFETANRFAEQLKGGPLRDSEKNAIAEGIEEGHGSVFERLNEAIIDVLHTNQDILTEKVKASRELQNLQKSLREEAYEWESLLEP